MSDGVHQALIRSNEVAAFPVVPGPGPVGIGCSQQLVPAPVLADDYGCADFDSGNLPEMNPGDQNWLALVPTPPAVLTTTTDRSSSPTYSLQTTASNATKAQIVWYSGSSGVANITHIVLAADVLPLGVQQSVQILGIYSGFGTVILYDGVTSSGTQLYLYVSYTGGTDTVQETYPLNGTLPLNAWTRVQIEVDTGAQIAKATIPGQTNAPVAVIVDPDSNAMATVGPWVQQGSFNGYFDDLVAYVYR